jgi:hypothetical protein
MLALKNNIPDIAHQILQHPLTSADMINAKNKYWGNTTLMHALAYHHPEIAIQILNDPRVTATMINAKTSNGDTALSLATAKGYTEVINLINKPRP